MASYDPCDYGKHILKEEGTNSDQSQMMLYKTLLESNTVWETSEFQVPTRDFRNSKTLKQTSEFQDPQQTSEFQDPPTNFRIPRPYARLPSLKIVCGTFTPKTVWDSETWMVAEFGCMGQAHQTLKNLDSRRCSDGDGVLEQWLGEDPPLHAPVHPLVVTYPCWFFSHKSILSTPARTASCSWNLWSCCNTHRLWTPTSSHVLSSKPNVPAATGSRRPRDRPCPRS